MMIIPWIRCFRACGIGQPWLNLKFFLLGRFPSSEGFHPPAQLAEIGINPCIQQWSCNADDGKDISLGRIETPKESCLWSYWHENERMQNFVRVLSINSSSMVKSYVFICSVYWSLVHLDLDSIMAVWEVHPKLCLGSFESDTDG